MPLGCATVSPTVPMEVTNRIAHVLRTSLHAQMDHASRICLPVTTYTIVLTTVMKSTLSAYVTLSLNLNVMEVDA